MVAEMTFSHLTATFVNLSLDKEDRILIKNLSD